MISPHRSRDGKRYTYIDSEHFLKLAINTRDDIIKQLVIRVYV